MGHFLNELDSVVVDLSVDQSQLDATDAIEFKDKAEVMFHNVNKALKSLHAAADKLDEAWSTAKITRVSGTSFGIVGGVLTIIGGVATVMTAGAATPLLAAGMGAGVIGAGTNIVGNIKESLINSKEIKKAESDLMKALESITNVKGAIHEWLEHKKISTLHKIYKMAEAKRWSKPVIKLLGVILLAAKEAYKESQAFAGPAAKFVASEAGKAAVKSAGIAGIAGIAGVGAAGKAGAKSAGKAGAESTGKAGAKAAGKAGAGAADDVLQAGIKAGGKLAGGFIIGISTVFLTWDIIDLGCTIRDLVEKKGSDAAKDLRQKAEILKKIMEQLEEEGSI